MATFYTNWYGGGSNSTRLKFVTSESVNSNANTSTVTVSAYYQNYNNNLMEDSIRLPVTMTLGGTTYNGSKLVDNASGSWILMKTISKTITHNADGTGSVSFTGSSSLYSLSMTTGSKTITLATIGHGLVILYFNVGSITLNTASINFGIDGTNFSDMQYSLNGGGWQYGTLNGTVPLTGLTPNTTYSCKIRVYNGTWTESSTIYFTTLQQGIFWGGENFTDEGNVRIYYNNKDSQNMEFYLEFPAGNPTASISRNVGVITGDTYDLILTEPERQLLRQKCVGNSMSVRYVIATKINGARAYWSYGDRTMTLINYKPTFTDFTFEDTDSVTTTLTGNNQTLIKGKSNLKTIISTANKMIANKEANAVKYRTNVGSKSSLVNYSLTDEVNMNIEDVDAGIIYVTAIDSRGNEKQVTKTATIINHEEPVISELKFERQNGVSSTINIIGSGTYTNVNFGSYQNTIAKIEYSIDDGTTWNNITSKFNIASGEFENKDGGNTLTGFTVGEEYNILFRVYDGNGANLLSNAQSSFHLTSGEPLFDINKSKKGVGINCIADEEGLWVDGTKINAEIVDNLESTSTDKPLSANQGRILNGKTDKLVASGSSTSATITISDLDITRDGGIYEFYLEGFVSVTEAISLTINDLSTNYYTMRHDLTSNITSNGSLTPSGYYFHNTANWSMGNINSYEPVEVRGNIAFYGNSTFQCTTNSQKQMYICTGTRTSTGNITSITFDIANNQGFKYWIFKK